MRAGRVHDGFLGARAGVVDENVDSTEGVLDRIGQADEVGGVRHVGPKPEGRSFVRCFDGTRHLTDALFIPRTERHADPFFCQRVRHRPANAGASSCDDGHLTKGFEPRMLKSLHTRGEMLRQLDRGPA